MTNKIEYKQVNFHLIPSEQSTGGNAGGSKQEKVDSSRVVGKLISY